MERHLDDRIGLVASFSLLSQVDNEIGIVSSYRFICIIPLVEYSLISLQMDEMGGGNNLLFCGNSCEVHTYTNDLF